MTTAKPLDGVTVVEFGHSVAAPFAGLALAALGAEVIKVENPHGGDHARGWGPPFFDGDASVFHGLNRGKSSVAVDLTDDEACATLRTLILDRADVVIQNMRFGVLDRFGLGGAQLVGEKPSLVYCDLSAFGEAGPLVAAPGYDPLMQAMGGIMSVTGECADRPPIRVGVSIVDIGTGMWSLIGILAALFERGRTGDGGRVSTSLFEAALSWMTTPLAGFAASGEVRGPHGSGSAEIVPYQGFETANGWLMIAAGNDRLFRRFVEAIGLPELGEDDRYRLNRDRVTHRDALIPVLAEAVRALPTDRLAADLNAAGIPNAPILDAAGVFSHEQTKALGIIGPGRGKLAAVNLPLSFDGVRNTDLTAAPKLGEHNAMVAP